MSSGEMLAVAVDLGGTQLRAALVDAGGKIHARAEEPTKANDGPEIVTDQIAAIVKRIAKDIASARIKGVGLSSPGPIDTREGIALDIPTLAGFRDVPVKTILSKKLGMALQIENDGIAAAIGEWKFGAGKGLANVVYVTVSTGIGGGVIIDSHVLRGKRGMSGHVGHMCFIQGGELCACGNRGCFEAYASGTAFTKRAAARGKYPNATAVFTAATEGDLVARSLIEEEGTMLGQGFASLLHLYSPDMLIMGGGMASQFDVLAPRMLESLRASTMPAFRDTPVVKAALGQNSGLVGAASLVFSAG